MGVLSPATIARLRQLPPRLAFHDVCEIRRNVDAGQDEFNNDLPPTPATVEVGPCSLKKLGQQGQAEERVIADRLQWQTPYLIDLPYDTLVTPKDRIRVNGDREFQVGGVVKTGELGIVATAVCEERG